MNVVSSGPLRVASLVWQPRLGTYVLTIVAKTTYRLAQGISPLTEYQEEPNQEDSYWNDDLTRSLFAPADLVPYKPRADILLVGHAFAPRQEPVRSLVTRLMVAGIDKTIEVHADRTLLPDGTVREGAPFTKMPIRYERAAAGAENPVGVRPGARAGRPEGIPLPNLQPPGLPPIRRADAIPPKSYGPIAPTWPTRLAKLPNRGSPPPASWTQTPMPEGLDPLYFNAAPADQQVDKLHADEGIILENLHLQYPLLRTNLPGLWPKAVVERTGPREEIAMNPDTLWIDTDSGLCTVTWRGHLRLERPDAPGRIQVSLTKEAKREPAAPPSPAAELSAPRSAAAELKPISPSTNPEVAHILRALGTSLLSELDEVTLRPSHSRGPALPFTAPPPGEPPGAPLEWAPTPQPDSSQGSAGATIVAGLRSAAGPVLPFGHVGEVTAPIAPEAEPSASAANAPQPPAIVRTPPSTLPVSPALKKSPWAAASPSPMPTSIPRSIVNTAAPPVPLDAQPRAQRGPAPAVVSTTPATSAVSSFGISTSTGPSSTAPKIGSVTALKQASIAASAPVSSAAHASNAAADPKPVPLKAPADRPPSRERSPVELLWFDRAFADAIRKELRFKSIFAEPTTAATPKNHDKKPPSRPAPGEADPRENIASVCAHGEPCSVEGLTAVMNAAIDERGMFSPPMVLMGGDLEFPFDEVETLKATVAAVTPLAASDKKLKETVDAISQLLTTPWLQSAGGVTERLTTQVREAFASSGNRLLPPGYLESHTERILLEQRHYQRRTLLGQVWIRALLAPTSSPSRVPAYLPQTLARELPMFRRLPVQIIAEARPQLDQYETCPMALRIVALVRVLDFGARP